MIERPPCRMRKNTCRSMGTLVIQGLLFTWACESRAMLKVQHPQYGMRIVIPQVGTTSPRSSPS